MDCVKYLTLEQKLNRGQRRDQFEPGHYHWIDMTDLDPLDALFTLSEVAIALAGFIAIALSYAGVSEVLTWQLSSFLWICITVSTSVYNIRNQSVISASGMDTPRVVSWLLWLTIGIVGALQIMNILAIKAFWPFYVATILVLAIGAISFSIIVMQFLRDRESAGDDS